MKKFLLIFTLLFFTIGVNAQSGLTATIDGTSQSLQQDLNNKFLNITMPVDVTKATIQSNLKYYKNYFTATFDESSHLLTINFVVSSNEARATAMRLLDASGIKSIHFEGDEYDLSKFTQEVLLKK